MPWTEDPVDRVEHPGDGAFGNIARGKYAATDLCADPSKFCVWVQHIFIKRAVKNRAQNLVGSAEIVEASRNISSPPRITNILYGINLICINRNPEKIFSNGPVFNRKNRGLFVRYGCNFRFAVKIPTKRLIDRYSYLYYLSIRKDVFMATNPIGKGTQTIGINMPQKMADDLEKRANSMHISKSKYCKIVLGEWLKSGKKLTLSEKN